MGTLKIQADTYTKKLLHNVIVNGNTIPTHKGIGSTIGHDYFDHDNIDTFIVSNLAKILKTKTTTNQALKFWKNTMK